MCSELSLRRVQSETYNSVCPSCVRKDCRSKLCTRRVLAKSLHISYVRRRFTLWSLTSFSSILFNFFLHNIPDFLLLFFYFYPIFNDISSVLPVFLQTSPNPLFLSRHFFAFFSSYRSYFY